MSWHIDLVNRLRGDSALAALVGQRIAWFEAARSWPDDATAIVMQEIDAGREYTHQGHDGLDRPRVQFDIYAVSGEVIFDVGARLVAAMEQAGIEQGSTRFGFGFLANRRMLDPETLASGARVQRLSIAFEFTHEII